MGDINECNPQRLLDTLQFHLHILAKPEIQSAQRLVQKQNLGPVYQRPGNSHPLLLTAGETVGFPVFVALQADDFQHLLHSAVNFVLGHLGHLQAESDVVIHIQMRE